ncbi:MAG: hypothetical protein CMD31_07370 [Flavobacteriales bacterium]|nr:hypothetical protein [Flavobacteriales bacterium]|tara:strand:- start:11628 stop:12230 length:603 start_codon:yes stop_codon:yes gene_type:complete
MEETKTIASEELLAEQLNNRDWDDFWLKLMGRCAWVLRKRYNVKWSNEELKSFSRDAISEIVNKVFITKKRNWNIDAYPDFEDFIVSAVDSQINNMLKKLKKEVKVGENEFLMNQNGETSSNIEETIISKELREQLFDELQANGADDNELLIFECLVDGIEKPEEIRKTIGLSEEDFHNAWRRFKRKREVIKQKLVTHGY